MAVLKHGCNITLALLLSLLPLTTLAASIQKHMYKVAIDAEYTPYEYVSENGDIMGYTPSLLRKMQPILGAKFKFIPMNWPDALQALEHGDVDIISMIETKKRLQKYAFTQSHSDIFQALFINKFSPTNISTLKDLEGKKVAFQANDISLLRLQDNTAIKKVIVTSKMQGFKLLETGAVDGFFVGEKAGKDYINKHGFKHYQLGIAIDNLFEQRFSFAMLKGRGDLVEQFNQALSQLEQKGVIEELKQTWLLKRTSIWQDHKLIILAACLIIFTMLCTVIILRIMLRKKHSQLQASEQKYRHLYNHAPVSFVTMDAKGVITLANKAFLKLIDSNMNDVVGQSFESFISPDEAPLFKENLSQLENKPNEHCSCNLISNSGHLLNTIILAEAQLDASGNLLQVNCSIEDVTAIKIAEEKNKKFLTAIDKSAEAIVITSANGTIEFVNQSFSETTGYSSEEALGKNPRILKSGNQKPEYYKQMWDDLLLHSRWQGRIINRKKDGSFYPALLTIAAVRDESGSVVNYIGIQQDMSEFEKLESQFQQAQKLEAIGTLVGGIAHDFNNSLAAISGNAFLAMNKLDADDPIRERMKIIQQAVDHSASIIRQLLTFSRKGTAEVSTVVVLPFLKEFEKFYQSVLPEDICLQLDLNITDESIQVDINLLQQALNNIVNNAVYATTEGEQKSPAVSIAACLVDKRDSFLNTQQALSNEFYVKISVIDNGSGIAEKDMPHIFDPFYTTKPEGSGSGLGLSMTYGMVSSHHGYIHFDSKEHEGTTCSLYFPLMNKEDGSLSKEAQKLLQGNNELILLVDDQDVVLETTKNLLKSFGYRVMTALNGEQGLRAFETHKNDINLIVSDVVMPIMGGLEMARRIKKIKPEVQVVFMTGYSTDFNDKKVPGSVKDSTFIRKPFDVVEFSKIIRANMID